MATSGIVGRAAEIAEIVRVLSPARREGQHRLVVVSGPAGVGKTSVAVHAAHQLADAFPDGQLYAEFGDATDPARRVPEVLAYFLRALGVPPEAVPSTLRDAVADFRSMTADRRLLVVLDAVPTAYAARALLPGSVACGVIISSRRELADLSVPPGAHGVPVGMLRTSDAYRVLSEALGDDRVEAEQAAADDLVRSCKGLPLAIRSAAAQLVTRPGLSIASYLEEVRIERAVPACPPGEVFTIAPVTPAQTGR